MTERRWSPRYRGQGRPPGQLSAEGCITVDMEAAAFFAVARYRNVRSAQPLYAGDSLAGSEWDERGWTTAEDVRKLVFSRSPPAPPPKQVRAASGRWSHRPGAVIRPRFCIAQHRSEGLTY
jgi:hypothetical protein